MARVSGNSKKFAICLDVIMTLYLYDQPINKTTIKTLCENIFRKNTSLEFALK